VGGKADFNPLPSTVDLYAVMLLHKECRAYGPGPWNKCAFA